MCLHHPTYAERNWPTDPPEPTEEEIKAAQDLVRSLPAPTPEDLAEMRRLGMIRE